MAIKFRCPSGHLLSIGEEYAGKRLRCPKCLMPTQIPQAGEPLAARAAANGHRGASTGGRAANGKQPSPAASGPDRNTIPLPPKPVAAPPAIKPRLPRENSAAAATDVAFEAAFDPVSAPNASARAQPTALVSSAPRSPAQQLSTSRPLGYQPDKHCVYTVYWLGLGLALVALFQTAPVVLRYDLALSPDWARLVMLLALVQLAFAVWIVLMPDWSTVRAAMFMLAGVAMLYAVALAIAVMTPTGGATILEMDDVLEPARLWSTAVLLLTCPLLYVCGHVSFTWRKQHELRLQSITK